MLFLKVTTGPNSGLHGFTCGEDHGKIALPTSLSKEDADKLARDLSELSLLSDNSSYEFTVQKACWCGTVHNGELPPPSPGATDCGLWSHEKY